FYHHGRLTQELGVKVYFADPYNSGQRGTNENTNGLIRQYFPKVLDYGIISHGDVRRVQTKLNDRPRLRLRYQTPSAVLGKHSKIAFRI
ncbi:MAG: IS30 family transposase, partial [Planctomycetota bacterium]